MSETDKLDGERGFLHDIANPLAIGFGNLEVALTKLTGDPNTPREFIIDRLSRAVKALERANQMVEQRRAELQREE